MKSDDIARIPGLREKYLKWKADPITTLVIEMVRLEGRCFMPRPEFIKSEIALAAMGENAGYHNALDRIMTLDQITQPQDNEPSATYGADELQKVLYPETATQQKGKDNGDS